MSNSTLQFFTKIIKNNNKITINVQKFIYSKIKFNETNRMQFCQVPPVSFRKICCSFKSLPDIIFQA